MSRKRRAFDIDMPPEEPAAPAPAPARRGPMATAVRETVEALHHSAGVEARIRAENDALAHEHVRLKKAGLVTDTIPTDLIDTTKLTRDRSAADPDALDELKASILAIGLSNPIRVERTPEGRYELIQGWRRLRAFQALEAANGDGRFARIPAGIVAPGDALSVSYRRMVDENMVRKDVSFAEMARLAEAYADDPATDCADVDGAVAALFRSAGYQKRSYIRAFAELLEVLGDLLRFPERLGRNLGLDLRRALTADAAALTRLREALAAAPDRDAEGELAILRAAVARGSRPASIAKTAPRPSEAVEITTSAGTFACSVTGKRLTLTGETDFAALDPATLEKALAAFAEALGNA